MWKENIKLGKYGCQFSLTYHVKFTAFLKDQFLSDSNMNSSIVQKLNILKCSKHLTYAWCKRQGIFLAFIFNELAKWSWTNWILTHETIRRYYNILLYMTKCYICGTMQGMFENTPLWSQFYNFLCTISCYLCKINTFLCHF